MRRPIYLAGARRDIARIIQHIASESGKSEIGARFAQRLQDKCRKLAALPGTMGRARPKLLPDIRSVAFGNYLIFFRYVDNRFEVVNIIEGHRDLYAVFGSPDDDHSDED